MIPNPGVRVKGVPPIRPPARRGHRSGATAPPFRRDGTPRSGATGTKRNAATGGYIIRKWEPAARPAVYHLPLRVRERIQRQMFFAKILVEWARRPG